jgi:ABC-type glycerol-3-phosphate transport system permease component
MRAIPRAIEDSAVIDGASQLQIIRHVFLPLTQSGIAVVIVLNFLAVWNEFMFAYIILNARTRTVQVAAATLLDSFTPDFGLISAGVIMSVLPALLIFVFFQRWIVEGIAGSAVKG